MINIKDFVVNKKMLSNIVADSVGIIKAINGENAMVLFVGENKILRVKSDNLKVINPELTGKGYDKKYVIFAMF